MRIIPKGTFSNLDAFHIKFLIDLLTYQIWYEEKHVFSHSAKEFTKKIA